VICLQFSEIVTLTTIPERIEEKEPFEWIEGASDGYFRSYVSADHQGPCAMSYFSRRPQQQHWAIFRSREEAMRAASGACAWDVGGYSNVTIHPVSAAVEGAEQFQAATEWLFGSDDVWEEPLQQTGVGAILRRSMREIARQIAAEPRELAELEWRDLERILFEVFDALGYNAPLKQRLPPRCSLRPSRPGFAVVSGLPVAAPPPRPPRRAGEVRAPARRRWPSARRP
jgi:hypothetical protein